MEGGKADFFSSYPSHIPAPPAGLALQGPAQANSITTDAAAPRLSQHLPVPIGSASRPDQICQNAVSRLETLAARPHAALAMAAENYWRYADARQQQQAMVAAAAAAAGMAPASTVTAAQTVGSAAAAMNQQAAVAAMAQQAAAAAPPLKRARPDFGDVSGGQDMTGYYPRDTDRAGYHSLRDNDAIGASYDRYLRNGMASVGASDTTRAAGMAAGMAAAGMAAGMGAGMGTGMGAGMAGYGVDDRRMMGIGMGYGGRPEPPLPPDASPTLYIEGLPANCTRREVSHIFRPFVGFREVRLVNKESRHPGGDPHVLCFVDFDNPAQAAIALEALQGYKFDEHDRDSAHLRLQFSRFPGPRSAGGPRGRR